MVSMCPNPACTAPLAPHSRNCLACGRDVGAPNVRAAREPAEIDALNLRYKRRLHQAEKDGYEVAFAQFEQKTSSSTAVMCMPPSRLLALATSRDSILSTFTLQVQGEARVAQDNRFDKIRTSVEEAFFPNYSREIRFAALSLSAAGQIAYGSCSVTLKESAISERASVFECPLFEFTKQHNIRVGDDIPPGFRALWDERGKLAVVKVAPALADAKVDYAEVLLPDSGSTLGDCIEVHIFGPLNTYSFERILMRPEKRREDRFIQDSIRKKFAKLKISVDVTI